MVREECVVWSAAFGATSSTHFIVRVDVGADIPGGLTPLQTARSRHQSKSKTPNKPNTPNTPHHNRQLGRDAPCGSMDGTGKPFGEGQ